MIIWSHGGHTYTGHNTKRGININNRDEGYKIKCRMNHCPHSAQELSICTWSSLNSIIWDHVAVKV